MKKLLLRTYINTRKYGDSSDAAVLNNVLTAVKYNILTARKGENNKNDKRRHVDERKSSFVNLVQAKAIRHQNHRVTWSTLANGEKGEMGKDRRRISGNPAYRGH